MGRRSRSRSRGGGGELSRRALLGGGVIAVGGAALVARSGAFSQSQTRREASVDAADDDAALVGVSVASSVVAGDDDQELVTITNNAGRELSVTVALSDSDDGEVVSPTAAIGADDAHTFSVSVVQDAETGEETLPFGIEATGDGSFHASMERRADVEEVDDPDEPTLRRSITDETRNTNAAFTIEYEVESVPDFDRLELDVENTNPDRNLQESFVRESPDGVISYPSRGTDGGAKGHTYVFTFEVYDANDQMVLSRTAERVAGEESDDYDDGIGGEDDPRLESATVTDESDLETDQVQFVVEYEVSNLERFGEVAVEFDNQEHSWSDRTVTSASAPTGTVTYPENGTQGGTSGQEYDIVVKVRRESGVTVDSHTITTVADGEDPPPYSRE